MKLSDDFVKKAEYYLYNIDKVKDEIIATREDIINLSSYDTTKTRTAKTNKVHDMTADRVEMLIDKTEEREAWLKVLQDTFKYYNKTPRGNLIYSKYVLKETVEETLQRLNISRSAYFKHRREILTYMAVQVAYNNLMSIDQLIA